MLNVYHHPRKIEVIEMWKPIKEWEDLYCVNELGEVLNVKTNKTIMGDINNAGYYRVCFYDKKTNRKKRYFRHRLVALHFIDNPNNYKEVNHIDGDKSNNSVTNLEWVDRKENEHHCRKEMGTKEYKPFVVKFKDGSAMRFGFKSQLSKTLGVTPACVKHWLHKSNQGYKQHDIVSIEYV